MALTLPEQAFFLFGIADRRKLLYRDGVVSDLRTGEKIWSGAVAKEVIEATETRITLETDRGPLVLREDAEGVFLGGERLTAGSKVNLPRFDGHKHAGRLRALHHELLVNIVDSAPLPNLLVYSKPWYRDAAMVAMALEKTGNIDLIRNWARSLTEPFDQNNIPGGDSVGETEADNLGQVLYLLSLVDNASHPLVSRVLREARRFERSGALFGRCDFADHPVYITKWMKFGLASLGLEDPYTVPRLPDSYSSLFWWDYRREHVACPRFSKQAGDNYPYLAWAEAHFHGDRPPILPRPDTFPYTWEAEASQARYAGMSVIGTEYVTRKIAAPHSWHAAEAFLYLLELT